MKFGSRVKKYFEVRLESRHECVISQWLFSIFFDRVVRLVKERATGRGVKLSAKNEVGGQLNKYYMQMTQSWWQSASPTYCE